MPTLETVQNAVETELIALIKTAWGVSKVHTQPKEGEPVASGLPEAFLLLAETMPAEEDEGSFCSESGRLAWGIVLHAKKPTADATLARAKRQKAQALRSALAAADFTHTAEMRWEGETYDVMESDLQAASGAYLIRVNFTSFVEWED